MNYFLLQRHMQVHCTCLLYTSEVGAQYLHRFAIHGRVPVGIEFVIEQQNRRRVGLGIKHNVRWRITFEFDGAGIFIGCAGRRNRQRRGDQNGLLRVKIFVGQGF